MCNCNSKAPIGTKILAPKKISQQIQAFLEKAQKEMDIDLKGCSYHCEWFTVCDPKCHQELICWWVCNLEDGSSQKVLAPKEISSNIQAALESINVSNIEMPDLKGCSYHCEWFTVCDPKCHQELICWWVCA